MSYGCTELYQVLCFSQTTEQMHMISKLRGPSYMKIEGNLKLTAAVTERELEITSGKECPAQLERGSQ